MPVVPKRPEPQDADQAGHVVQFPRRRARRPSPPAAAARTSVERDSIDDFVRNEREPDERIDYRHRTLTNFIAVAIVSLLIGAGVWIADTIADLEKDQDCAMQGRSNCTPVEAPVAAQH